MMKTSYKHRQQKLLFATFCRLTLVRRFPFLLLIVVFLLSSWRTTTTTTSRRNIVFVMCDAFVVISPMVVKRKSLTIDSLSYQKLSATQGGRRNSSSNTAGSNKKLKTNNKIKSSSSTRKATATKQPLSKSVSKKSNAIQRQQESEKQPLPKQQKSSTGTPPPWQVLSPKDAKRNIEREKERRASIKQGLIPTHYQEVDDEEESGKPKLLSKNFLSPSEQKFLKWRRFNPTTRIARQKYIGSFDGTTTSLQSLGVPEIAFVGRSNVGKSSLLNKLVQSSSVIDASNNNNMDFARVGKTPGATASVNLYALYDNKGREILGFVDLPGFGYARLSKERKESVQQMAEQYLNRRKELTLVILLVDIRRFIEQQKKSNNKKETINTKYDDDDDERNVLNALYDMGIPVLVVATKIDKITMSEKEMYLRSIQDHFELPDGQPFCVSSTTGEGIKQLWQIILEGCEIAIEEANIKYEGEVEQVIDNDTNNYENEEQRGGYGETDGYSDDDDDDDDDDDVYYSQGYDWITEDSSAKIMYEPDGNDYKYFDYDNRSENK